MLQEFSDRFDLITQQQKNNKNSCSSIIRSRRIAIEIRPEKYLDADQEYHCLIISITLFEEKNKDVWGRLVMVKEGPKL